MDLKNTLDKICKIYNKILGDKINRIIRVDGSKVYLGCWKWIPCYDLKTNTHAKTTKILWKIYF